MTPDAGWARARWVLEDILSANAGFHGRANVGWVKQIGQGLSRDAYAAEVETLPDGHRDTYVVLLPARDAEPALGARTRREARLLGRLATMELPFRTAEAVGTYPEVSARAGEPGDAPALVCKYVWGVPLDLRAGRQPSVRPWEVVAEIAAAIHAMDGVALADILPGYSTRREHAAAVIASSFAGLHGPGVLEEPEIRDAHAWAVAHMPPDTPAALVHGDLMGQNILLGLSEPSAVIDWEYATRGDPAYDLAIVTRGVRKPFQVAGGLERLLEAYREHGGDVTAEQVRVYELCLAAGRYRDSLEGLDPHPPDQTLALLRGLVKRTMRTRP